MSNLGNHTLERLLALPGPGKWLAPMNRFGLTVLALSALAVSCTSKQVPLHPLDWKTVQPGKTGINANYLFDGQFAQDQIAHEWTSVGAGWIRYPGGDKSDNHLWADPPYLKPRPRTALPGPWAWPAGDGRFFEPLGGTSWKVDPLDFDEFIALCQRTGARPLVVVAQQAAFRPRDSRYGAISEKKLIEHAVAWVRYCRERGLGVRHWEIGNEPYLDEGQTAAQFGDSWSRFAQAMKAEDPDIQVGVNGPEMAAHVGPADRATAERQRWWSGFFSRATMRPDWISIHDYPCWEWRGFDAYATRHADVQVALGRVRAALAEAWGETDAARIPLLVTEANSADWLGHPQNNGWSHRSSLGHGLVLFDMLGQYLMDGQVQAAMVWNTRWLKHAEAAELWDSFAPDGSLQPTGRALAVWARFYPSELAVADLPQAPGLRTYAGRGHHAGAGCLFIINKTRTLHTLALPRRPAAVHAWTGSSPDDPSPHWSATPAVRTLELPPHSLTVVEGLALGTGIPALEVKPAE